MCSKHIEQRLVFRRCPRKLTLYCVCLSWNYIIWNFLFYMNLNFYMDVVKFVVRFRRWKCHTQQPLCSEDWHRMPGFVAACTYWCNRDAVLLVCFSLIGMGLCWTHNSPGTNGSPSPSLGPSAWVVPWWREPASPADFPHQQGWKQWERDVGPNLPFLFHFVFMDFIVSVWIIFPSLQCPLVLTCSPPGLQIQAQH